MPVKVCYPKIKILCSRIFVKKVDNTLFQTSVNKFVTRSLHKLWDYRLLPEPVVEPVFFCCATDFIVRHGITVCCQSQWYKPVECKVQRIGNPLYIIYRLLPEPEVEPVVLLSTTVPLIVKVCFGCASFVSTYTSFVKVPARFVSYLTSIVAVLPG
jgi:hypothetical protein